MALVPFSYASPFTDQLQLAERIFTIDGRLLRIRQAWKGDGKGGTDIGFGASVYPAAYVLAEYLERNPQLVRGKRVVELGTGTGFLGIATSILGAAEVCLTDGDEQSVKLTQENINSNLDSLPCRQGPRTSRRCDEQRALDAFPENGDGSDSLRLTGASRAAAAAAASADARGGRKPSDQSAKISARKLRWGCEDDMRAAGCVRGGEESGDGGDDSVCRPWDVVLGSDIAALPYASAYGDLLQTIVSLVHCGRGANATPLLPRKAGDAPEEAMDTGEREEAEETDSGRKTRPVVVLLAHKRRHVSEEAFFEDLKERLGGKQSVREMGEGDIHADFRGTGIRLHMFQVDV